MLTRFLTRRRASFIRSYLTAVAVVGLMAAQSAAGAAGTTRPQPTCGSKLLEGTLVVPRNQGVHRVLRITSECAVIVESEDVVPLAEVERLQAAEMPASNRAAIPDLTRSTKGPGLNARSALVAGGPLHMKVRVLDAINLDVTSINPHDLSYGYDGQNITSYSHNAWQTWATDNTGFCGSGY